LFIYLHIVVFIKQVIWKNSNTLKYLIMSQICKQKLYCIYFLIIDSITRSQNIFTNSARWNTHIFFFLLRMTAESRLAFEVLEWNPCKVARANKSQRCERFRTEFPDLRMQQRTAIISHARVVPLPSPIHFSFSLARHASLSLVLSRTILHSEKHFVLETVSSSPC